MSLTADPPQHRGSSEGYSSHRFYDETKQLTDRRLSQNARMSIVEDAADEEVQSGRAVERPWYIIMPFFTWKSRWDLMVLLLVLISSYMIPFDVAYRADIDPPECSSLFLEPSCTFGFAFDSVEVILIVIFVTDLVFSFFVSFQDADHHWKISITETARQYARTWLVIDLLAIVPFDQFASSDASVLSMSKVLRLLRLGKLLKRSQNMVTSTRAVLSRFLRMLMLERGMLGLYVFDLYSSLCVLLGESLIQDDPTVGVQIVAMFTMLVGAVVLAAVFGNVAMLVANYNISKTQLMEKMEQAA
ncbi:MAG: hypothetical protein SGPRY_011219 [Prymnesium sp.]